MKILRTGGLERGFVREGFEGGRLGRAGGYAGREVMSDRRLRVGGYAGRGLRAGV